MADDASHNPCSDDDIPGEFANLGEAQTGVPGVIFISSAFGAHQPRVRYSLRPGPDEPGLYVTIAPEPRVSSDQDVHDRLAPRVIAWVRLNHAELVRFWRDGDQWMYDDVQAFVAGLKRVEPGDDADTGASPEA